MGSRRLVVAAVLLATTACSGSGPSPESGPTSSATTTASPSPTATPTASPTASPTEDPCPPAERRAARSLWRLWDVVAKVATSLDGASPEATERLRALTRKAVDRVGVACDGTPPTMSPYLKAVRDVGRRPLDHHRLDAVLTGFAAWTDRLGLEIGSKRLDDLRTCREAARQVRASARVWWARTSTGRVWWVDLTFRSSIQRSLYGETGGRLRITGLLRDRFGWSDAAVSAGPGRDAHAGWGGSSADSLGVGPGTSTQRLAPGADTDVHTTATGTVRVELAEVYVYVPGAGWPCWLPVPVTY